MILLYHILEAAQRVIHILLKLETWNLELITYNLELE